MSEKIKTVAIIGMGYMGKIIASQISPFDYNIRIYDEISDKLELLARKIKRKKKTKGVNEQVTFHKTLNESIVDVDLIIECIPENLELKREVFSQIDKVAPSHAIIATNSSSIPVSRIEKAVQRKDKVLNMHFYHPAVPMVEIMKGTKTSDETFDYGKKFIESIGLTPILIKKESFGFVCNRMWHAARKEALDMWANDNADIETIDKAWKIFTRMDFGPFELMDSIGLDTVYNVHMEYFKETGDIKKKPPEKLKEMIDRGELGMKTKKGFYSY